MHLDSFWFEHLEKFCELAEGVPEQTTHDHWQENEDHCDTNVTLYEDTSDQSTYKQEVNESIKSAHMCRTIFECLLILIRFIAK